MGRWPTIDRRWEAKAERDWAPAQSQPFSAAQTVIPTPYMSKDRAASDAPRAAASLPSELVQAQMFAWPDVMRGQLALETDRDA